MKKLLPLLSLILLSQGVSAQNKVPFDSLINVLEKQFAVVFYYDKNQTNGLSIPSATGKLDDILKTTLEGTGLSFYRDYYNRVFISRGTALFTPLPKNFFATNEFKKDTLLPITLEETVVAKVENRVYIIGNKGGTGSSAVISGYIRDAKNGEPLSATSITLEGSQTGVSTDAF